jgi:RNA polymerase sigma factor (sigma-70 family)
MVRRTHIPRISLRNMDKIASPDSNPYLHAEKNEILQELHKIMRLMPDRMRKVLELRAEGYSSPVLSAMMGISRQRVDQINARAIEMLGDIYHVKRMKHNLEVHDLVRNYRIKGGFVY